MLRYSALVGRNFNSVLGRTISKEGVSMVTASELSKQVNANFGGSVRETSQRD